MSDKCSHQKESCADGQDLAYSLHPSETEGNSTNARATNSDKLLSCPYCVSSYQQIIIACLHHVTTTLKLKPGKNSTNTDTHGICFRGTVTLEVLLCPGAQITCRSTGHFWIPEAGQEEYELPFLPQPIFYNKQNCTILGRKLPQLERPCYLDSAALQGFRGSGHLPIPAVWNGPWNHYEITDLAAFKDTTQNIFAFRIQYPRE